MKYFTWIFIVAATIISCKSPQSFEYKGVQNLRLEKAGFQQSILSLDINYYNPNNFGVQLKQVDCDVFINNQYLGKYKLDTNLYIPKKAPFSLPSRMYVDMKGIWKNAFTVLFNEEVQIDIKGTTRVGKKGIYLKVPVDYSTRQKLSLF